MGGGTYTGIGTGRQGVLLRQTAVLLGVLYYRITNYGGRIASVEVFCIFDVDVLAAEDVLVPAGPLAHPLLRG